MVLLTPLYTRTWIFVFSDYYKSTVGPKLLLSLFQELKVEFPAVEILNLVLIL